MSKKDLLLKIYIVKDSSTKFQLFLYLNIDSSINHIIQVCLFPFFFSCRLRLFLGFFIEAVTIKPSSSALFIK